MKSLRPELDGRRLIKADRTRTLLVFHGLRHHITSSALYDALFQPDITCDEAPDLDRIADGPDLTDGIGLVSNAENGEIHLVVDSPSINIRKHLIATFTALGFNDTRVRKVLSAVPAGRPVGRSDWTSDLNGRRSCNLRLCLRYAGD